MCITTRTAISTTPGRLRCNIHVSLVKSLLSHMTFNISPCKQIRVIITKCLCTRTHFITPLHPLLCILYHLVAVRLAGGSSDAEGRVEVYINGVWGAVCGFFWDSPNSEVVCRQLGYSVVNCTYYGTNFGSDTGRSWLLNLFCFGSEENLLQCQHDGVGLGCPHSEDVGVVCVSEDLPDEGEYRCVITLCK